MKKKHYLIAALAFIGLIALGAQSASTLYEIYIKYHKTSPFLINTKDKTGATPFWVSNDGDVHIGKLNATGVTKFTRDATVINSATQLSTWSGQAAIAGQSYYATEAGKRYIVDLYAIKTSSAMGAFGGVTLMLPDASVANNEATVDIELAVTGITGYAQWMNKGTAAGVTRVFVFPYSAGTTAYSNGPAAYAAQTLQTHHRWIQGVTLVQGNFQMGSGVSFWALDKPGESATFALKNASQVSAYVKDVYVVN
jgi:hypothetical protein